MRDPQIKNLLLLDVQRRLQLRDESAQPRPRAQDEPVGGDAASRCGERDVVPVKVDALEGRPVAQHRAALGGHALHRA